VNLDLARGVADAVLYEGYLLYPYRATSGKNQSRWQFGVLGPPGAAADGLGEESAMSAECLLGAPSDGAGEPTVTLHLRFLQLQLRSLERAEADGAFAPVPELTVDGQLMFSWDEAVEHEVVLPTCAVADLPAGSGWPVRVEGGEDRELLRTAAGRLVGRVVRRRAPLQAEVWAETTPLGPYLRLALTVDNTAPGRAVTKDDAIRRSLIGAHVLVQARGRDFVSLLEPPADAVAAVAECRQHRCWPVLAGPAGSADVVLASPIILYDYPEIAPQSAGALFDGTEIDEILTLRVMTMTDAEKAEAAATDPRAREIIERCDTMTASDLQDLHGILRNPHAVPAGPELVEGPSTGSGLGEPRWLGTGEMPWWDPAVDERVQPEVDAVLVDGVSVRRGSLVRVHPSRRADAQDLFFADQVARVTAVLSDVDGSVHVALVLVDDPASDLHDWYGRYLYFAPDELEPLTGDPAQPLATTSELGKEGHP
jgi:hypothetical protein